MDRVEKLKELLKDNPNDSFLKHALALENIKTGDDPSAKALFEEILANDPGYVGTYYHLGKLLERMGEKESAIDWYAKGMEAAKAADNRHAYNELQVAYEDLTD